MTRTRHYVPVISRPVVAALYHEARRHRLPMTRFLDRLLREGLRGSPGWHQALRRQAVQAATPGRDLPSA